MLRTDNLSRLFPLWRVVRTYLHQTRNASRFKRRFLLSCFSLDPLAHALTGEGPGYPKPVSADLMKKTRGSVAVEVDLVSVRDGANLSEIEVSIKTLKCIEGPRYSPDC